MNKTEFLGLLKSLNEENRKKFIDYLREIEDSLQPVSSCLREDSNKC